MKRGHAALACAVALAACHPATEAQKDPERCATCHMDDFRAATQPVHAGQLPSTCAICHTQDAWKPSVMDHPWPLTGAHEKASCFECHKGDPPKFGGTAKACYACHSADYIRAPNHVARKYPTTCDGCHTAEAWNKPIGAPVEPLPKAVLPGKPAASGKTEPSAHPPPPKPKPAKPDVTTNASPPKP
jgi:hypothetical protein